MNTEIELNYEMYKERNKELEKSNRKLLKSIIRISPRETVIEVLKELKILKTDLNLKTNKMEVMENEKRM